MGAFLAGAFENEIDNALAQGQFVHRATGRKTSFARFQTVPRHRRGIEEITQSGLPGLSDANLDHNAEISRIEVAAEQEVGRISWSCAGDERKSSRFAFRHALQA